VPWLVLAVAFGCFVPNAHAVGPENVSWSETFTNTAEMVGEGRYEGDESWTFKNTMAILDCGTPSTTLQMIFGGKEMTMAETVPYASFNPEDPAGLGLDLGTGAVTSFGYVDQVFDTVVVSATVNSNLSVQPPGGSISRQGVVAMWDGQLKFYGFHVDFVNGEIGIIRQEGQVSGSIMDGSRLTIPGFLRTLAYQLSFEVTDINTVLNDPTGAFGQSMAVAAGRQDARWLRGSLFDATGTGTTLLLQTPWIQDPVPHDAGISGIVSEAAFPSSFPILSPDSEFFVPLTGSFSQVSAVGTVNQVQLPLWGPASIVLLGAMLGLSGYAVVRSRASRLSI
jgi:hypothetical protein